MKRIFLLIFCAATTAMAWCAVPRELISAGQDAIDDGNFDRARYFFESALENTPEDSIPDRYEIYGRLHNLMRYGFKRYDLSLSYALRSLAIMKQYGGGINNGLWQEYNLVANDYAHLGNREQALCYVDSAAQCLLLPGGDTQTTIHGLNMLAIVCNALGEREEVLSLYKMAVDFCRRRPADDDLLTSLNLYANQLFALDRLDEALEAYAERVPLAEHLHGRDSKEYRWAAYNMANILAFAGRIDEGGKCFADVAAEYRRALCDQLRLLPSEKRNARLEESIEIINAMVPFGIAAKFNADSFTRTAYEGILLTKGLLLASERSTADIIARHGSAADKENLARLSNLQQKLLEMEAGDSADSRSRLEIYNHIKRLDADIAASCASYGDIASFASAGYDDIRLRLSDDEVLLDFFDFKPRSRPRQYYCFEIRRSLPNPRIHYVCSGAQIDSLLTLENHLWGNLYNGEAGDDMNRIIGEPLSAIIGDARRVYYVPSGVFHKLSVEAIPVDEDTRMTDRRDFRRLSSARELLLTGAAPAPLSARLYGGLQYATESLRLPYSADEVREIAALPAWQNTPEVLTGLEGTKQSVLDMAGASPDALLFSTHGFYYTPADSDLPASLKGYNNAMRLSGMLMAGGSLDSPHGILTADEISRCDLGATSLACLASCRSGQGEVTSEGIYGLQRAFKKAGVRTLVMHLWDASDAATRCFMTSFYRDLLSGSNDSHKAFAYARAETRRQYPSPFYWAGFIMVD